jgi:DNA ligase 4
LKKADSTYKPSERSASHWIKLKTEYIDQLGDTLDLVILGGYYGKERRVGRGTTDSFMNHISQFLVGIMHKVDLKNPKNSIAKPFARVGTGYSDNELQVLREKLKPYMVTYDSRFSPIFMNNWKYLQHDRPDAVITDLSKSMVLEIKASELCKTENYPTGLTLRFPRVVKIRYDKDWHDVMGTSELKEMN